MSNALSRTTECNPKNIAKPGEERGVMLSDRWLAMIHKRIEALETVIASNFTKSRTISSSNYPFNLMYFFQLQLNTSFNVTEVIPN